MPMKTYSLQPHFFADASNEGFPVQIRAWQNETLTLPASGTHYGFVWQGTSYLRRSQQSALFPLCPGMYFSLAEAATLQGEHAAGIVITTLSHRGRFQLGGPIDPTGQFAYIDGGTTSLLIAPMAQGDPCLNALYMPPKVDQTVHAHPSDRIGIIIQGTGECFANETRFALAPGTLFHIPAHQLHKFCTDAQPLHLIVFHPDSDMGFTQRRHPMLSRTLVNNVSATELPTIQTPI
jgi:mannose-6-phosphate isomerase-like protein (cupin superfamily)